MKSFSQRYGYKKVRKNIQSDSFDQETTRKLWDVIYHHLISIGTRDSTIFTGAREYRVSEEKKLEKINERITTEVFRQPADKAPKPPNTPCWEGTFLDALSCGRLKDFWFRASFSKKMDIIEILCEEMKSQDDQDLRKKFNETFKSSLVPYRIPSNGRIIKVGSLEIEDQEIGSAIEQSNYIAKAEGFLFNRENPDYLNVIKESVLAIEHECKQFGGKSFTACLDSMKEELGMHPAWKKMLEGLYGFSSDVKGIRHDGKTKSEVDFEEAKLVLVLCSAVVNYLKEKRVKQKRPLFDFNFADIPHGEELVFVRDETVTCIVSPDQKNVIFQNETMSLSEASALALGNPESLVPGSFYWNYEGETLGERQERLERKEEKEMEEAEDTWRSLEIDRRQGE